MKIDLFDYFYISHIFSIQLGHFFEKSTSLTYYKWSKIVIFQFPRCNLFPIKLRLICSSWSVIRNIWMTAVKLHPEVSTLIQQPHKHTAHKKPLAIFITAATHWASARETILLHLYKKKASESDSLHKCSALMLLFQTTAVWGLIIIKLCFFSGVLVNDFQIAVNIRSEQFFGPVGESRFKRFATSLAQVLTRWEVSCLSATLSLSLSHPTSLDWEVKFCFEAKYFSQQAHAKRFME